MTEVVFSHDIFCAQRMGGVGRSMIELARALSLQGSDWALWAGDNENELLAAATGEDWAQCRIIQGRSRHPGRVLGSLRNEPRFARWVSETGTRVVHRSYYPVLDLVGRKAAHVETLHDMWDERSGERASPARRMLSALKKRALRRADVIACVSESTRAELGALWPWALEKSVVIPHGVRPLASNRHRPKIDRPFFLFVGRRGSYKNFALLPEALKQSELNDHLLVCFGGGPLTSEEAAAVQDAGLTGRVLQMGGSDALLAGCLEAADALLYPSKYEGFGLPLLEAMIHHCPVIAAPLTSLPEVGGDAALYAPADDSSAWAAEMRRIADDRPLREQIVSRGCARAAEFDWSRTAAAYREIYRKLT